MSVLSKVALICFAYALTLSINGQSSRAPVYRDMADPIFGLKFDPKQVHFDVAPKKILDRCSELQGRTLWVFAHAVNGKDEYFIVSGYVEHRPDSASPNSGEFEADFGSTVILTAQSCIVEPADAFLTAGGNDPDPPEAQSRALATDAISKMISSFGGKDSFCQRAKDALAKYDAAQTRLPAALRTRIAAPLREELNKACAMPDQK
jgi:hypothetical protein